MINSQLKSVLVGLCVVGSCFAQSSVAAAQDGGPTLEPAASGSAGGSREPLISGSTVDVNDGAWVAGGLNFIANSGHDVGFRVEAGLPIVDLPVGRLSVYLPFVMNPNHYPGGYKNNTFIIDPGVRYEVSLLERYGRLSLFGDFGFGVWIDQYKDPVFGNGSTTYASLRAATGVSFTFPFGLYLILEPVGVVTAMGHNNGAGFYEYSVLAGYRF